MGPDDVPPFRLPNGASSRVVSSKDNVCLAHRMDCLRRHDRRGGGQVELGDRLLAHLELLDLAGDGRDK
jgi:hypothetical protein